MTNAILAYFFYGFFCVVLLGYPYICMLKHLKSQGQPIRTDGPQQHHVKKGTPTMGGVLILFSILLDVIMLPQLLTGVTLGVIVVFLGYAILGGVDDWKKLMHANAYAGLTPRQKLFFQIVIALIGLVIVLQTQPLAYQYHVFLPILNVNLNLGYLFIPFAVFVIVGASNAVNLTDGLDGLVTIPVVLVLAVFLGIVTFVNPSFIIPFSNLDLQNLQILILTIIGACFGFLYFNLYPAKIFMGDVGSLSLGGMLGTLSIALKLEFFLAIAGGIFIIETISVMIQVVYFRKTGKRFFKMAPIHHHFEHLGFSETQVVRFFWGVAFVFAILAIALAMVS